jgi:hypothetical protein
LQKLHRIAPQKFDVEDKRSANQKPAQHKSQACIPQKQLITNGRDLTIVD